jgi:hypothetical protein
MCGAAAVMLSLPEISTLNPFNPSIFDWYSFPADPTGDEESPLDRFLLGRRSGNPYVAQAQVCLTQGSPQQLLDAPSALLDILDQLNLPKSFSGRVDYRNASGCRQNFQNQEALWRNSFASYTDVQRSPADRDVAYLVAGNISSSNHLVQAQGSSQYQGNPAVALSGDDPGVLVAAKSLLSENYNLPQRQTAQSLAPTVRRPERTDDGQTAMRYETPTTSILRLPPSRRAGRFGQRSRGAVIAHNKADRRNPNNLYFAELYV